MICCYLDAVVHKAGVLLFCGLVLRVEVSMSNTVEPAGPANAGAAVGASETPNFTVWTASMAADGRAGSALPARPPSTRLRKNSERHRRLTVKVHELKIAAAQLCALRNADDIICLCYAGDSCPERLCWA
jgi:hypothetical protein